MLLYLIKAASKLKSTHPSLQTTKTVKTSKIKPNKSTDDSITVKEDPFVSIGSTHCSSSIKSEDSERNDLLLKNETSAMPSTKHTSSLVPVPAKNYILCHVRKIDQNYKNSKISTAKRRGPIDLEGERDAVTNRKRKKTANANKAQANLVLKSNPTPKQISLDAYQLSRKKEQLG